MASLARVAGVLSKDVAVDKIESINSRRQLVVTSIRVEASVGVADKAAANEMAGRLTADEINSKLAKAGLPAASMLVSAEARALPTCL